LEGIKKALETAIVAIQRNKHDFIMI
jgi:hypothetical protein